MNNKKIINAWCSYDIANSVYNLLITTVIFPIYYHESVTAAFHGEIVKFFNFHIKSTVLYDYAIAAAYLVIVFLSPFLSGIADYTGKKKRFMQFFTYLGAISCAGLFWFKGVNIEYGIILVGLAVIGYAGSLVFYNSFLPLIATPDRHDRISARGFSWGYAGSVFLLILCILTINTYSFWGFENKTEAVKASFLAVGVWWISISAIAFYFLKDAPTNHPIGSHVLSKGFKELATIAKRLAKMPVAKRFLAAFFFYSMGVQTVMLVATLFGTTVLHIPTTRMIITLIVLQLVGIVGATLFAKVSERKGNKVSIGIMLCIWIVVCISAFYISNQYHFYMLAAAVGLVMGGIQSQSRSTYSKLIPRDTVDTASFFSFYDVTEKLSIVIGLFVFGLIEHITGDMRISTISLSIFFIIGFIIIAFTKFPAIPKND
jgi:UMF1 family MFS transporter